MSLEERVTRLERALTALLGDNPSYYEPEASGLICSYCHLNGMHFKSCEYQKARDIMQESSDG